MRFLILAVSYKHGGLCVAGLDHDTFKFVRIGKARVGTPNCLPLSQSDIIFNNRALRICDLVDIDVVKMPTVGCQTENYELKKINRFIKRATLDELAWIYARIPHTDFVFFNGDGTFSGDYQKDLNYSIGFFKVDRLTAWVNNNVNGIPKYKVKFIYSGNIHNGLYLTDCAMCDYPHDLYGGNPIVSGDERFKTIGEAYIMVTLPATPWEMDNNYYKYVSGVIVCGNEVKPNRVQAEIVEIMSPDPASAYPKPSPKRVVELHDTVTIKLDGGIEHVYIGENYRKITPVWTGDNNNRVSVQSKLVLAGSPVDGFISNESPLAKAILGKSVGAAFTYSVNGREIAGEILKIQSSKKA